MLHYICNEVILVLAPVVQRADNSTQRINHYPVDSALRFDSDLSDGWRYLPFNQPGPKVIIIQFRVHQDRWLKGQKTHFYWVVSLVFLFSSLGVVQSGISD